MPKASGQPDSQARKRPSHKAHAQTATRQDAIDWGTWWPFDRATGEALRQLNKKSVTTSAYDETEEAPI